MPTATPCSNRAQLQIRAAESTQAPQQKLQKLGTNRQMHKYFSKSSATKHLQTNFKLWSLCPLLTYPGESVTRGYSERTIKETIKQFDIMYNIYSSSGFKIRACYVSHVRAYLVALGLRPYVSSPSLFTHVPLLCIYMHAYLICTLNVRRTN